MQLCSTPCAVTIKCLCASQKAGACGIRFDAAIRTVSFILQAATLSKPATLRGAKVSITTWDCDSEDRAMGTAAQPFAIGGNGPGDASAVIVRP